MAKDAKANQKFYSDWGLKPRPIGTLAFNLFRDEFERLVTFQQSMETIKAMKADQVPSDPIVADAIGNIGEQLYTSETWDEMWLCRHTDNFLSFLSETLGTIFRKQPATMKSNEKVEMDVVLSYANQDEMISGLAERKVEKLGHEGIRDLAKFFNDRLNFQLFVEPRYEEAIGRLIALRNIVVHNRGIVNQTFLNQTGIDLELGGKVLYGYEWGGDIYDFYRVAVDVDDRAVAKWKMNTINWENK